MPDLGIVVTGDRKVGIRFEAFPAKVHDTLLSRIRALTSELEARVKAAAPKKSGKLQSDIYSEVFDDGDKITGWVSVADDFAKAAALEWGARRGFTVDRHSAQLDHIWEKRLAAPVTVIVAAHKRQANIIATRFERNSLAGEAPVIEAVLEQTMAEAAAAGDV